MRRLLKEYLFQLGGGQLLLGDDFSHPCGIAGLYAFPVLWTVFPGVRRISLADPQDIWGYFINQDDFSVTAFQPSQLQLSVYEVQPLRSQFFSDDRRDAFDKLFHPDNLVLGHYPGGEK